jgi:IS1 family transposase
LTASERTNNAAEMGDRWTYVAVLPESSDVHTVHSGQRNNEAAEAFIQKVKNHSNGVAPYFESDGWFYEEALTKIYRASVLQNVPYKGRGRKPLPVQVPDPELKYAQVVKERQQGKVVSITTRIVLGDEIETMQLLEKSTCSTTVSTSFVESRNGAFRKDNARQARKTKCHSKKIEPHDAQVILLKSIYNLTKENKRCRILINSDAKLFENKYKKVSPAMKQGLVQRIYSLEELLYMKPIMFAVN